MIRLNLMAGMGNQMFEYAFARALSLEYREKLEINPYFMTLAGFGAGRKSYFNNVLSCLNIPEEILFLNKKMGYLHGVPDIVEFVTMRKHHDGIKLHGEQQFSQMCSKGKIYTDDCFTYYPYIENKAKIKKIIGYYQSEKYFAPYSPVIKKELLVNKEPSDNNKRKIEELNSCNAVCVHIRRGDYISNQKNEALVVCDENYYRKGMRYIAEQTKNPVFYIFSDNLKEIEWIKQNYHLDFDVQYIELNNPDYEELRLMYQCRHFVIANSTFSWWGSYLSANEDKIIVAPKIWNKNYFKRFDIYTEKMILV